MSCRVKFIILFYKILSVRNLYISIIWKEGTLIDAILHVPQEGIKFYREWSDRFIYCQIVTARPLATIDIITLPDLISVSYRSQLCDDIVLER